MLFCVFSVLLEFFAVLFTKQIFEPAKFITSVGIISRYVGTCMFVAETSFGATMYNAKSTEKQKHNRYFLILIDLWKEIDFLVVVCLLRVREAFVLDVSHIVL